MERIPYAGDESALYAPEVPDDDPGSLVAAVDVPRSRLLRQHTF